MHKQRAKPQVTIIFPDLNPATPTHYWYWQQLFNKIKQKKLLDLKLINETTTPLFSRPLIILKSRLAGCTNFYIHYSFSSLLISWLITRILGGTTYFWHCEKYESKLLFERSLGEVENPNQQPSSRFSTPLRFARSVKHLIWNNYAFRLCLRLTDYLITGHQVVAQSYTQIFGVPKSKIKIVPNYVINIPPRLHAGDSSGRDPVGAHSADGVRSTNGKDSSTGLPAEALAKAEPAADRQLLSKNLIHILFIHHLSPRKGSRELPQIIKPTLEKIPQAHFHIIGSGPDKQWLEPTLIRNLKLEIRNFTIYGSLPLPQAISFYQSADYLILPSRAEGFPRVILEAMFYKIPFVATDVGCIQQIVSPAQYQFIVPPQKPQAFTKSLIQLINLNPKRKAQLIKSNHQQSLKYNQSEAIRCFVRLFSTPKT